MPSTPTPLFSDGYALNEEQKGQGNYVSEHNPASAGSAPSSSVPLFQTGAPHGNNDVNIDGADGIDFPANYLPDNPYGIGNKPGASGNGEPEGRVGVGTIHGALGIYEGQAVQNGPTGDFPFVDPQSTYSSDPSFGGDVNSGGDPTWHNM
jgi:hypothetical protein